MIKHYNLSNRVTFYTELNGARVILLEAKLEAAYDMPRLYRLAREALNDLNAVFRVAA